MPTTFSSNTSCPSENFVVTGGPSSGQQVLIAGSELSTTSQSGMNQILDSMNSYSPITLMVTMDTTIISVWARVWAVTHGVPFIDGYARAIEAGYNHFQSSLAVINQVSNIVTFGQHSRASAAAAVGNLHGKSVIQM